MLVKNEHNNPSVPMGKAGYDLSKSRVQRLTKKMANSASKVILILDRKHQSEIPAFLKELQDLEIWEIRRISDDISFDESCRLERMRIKRIEKRVKNLVERIG